MSPPSRVRKNLLLKYAAVLLGVAAMLLIWMIVSPDGPPDPATKPLPLPVGFRAEMLADQTSPGAIVFIKTCGQCHELPNPKLHSDTEWPGVVVKMAKHLILRKTFYRKPLFVPDDPEHRLLVVYLLENGIKAMPTRFRATTPEGVLFQSRCAQCHALPHPIQHTPAEWPAVVARMRQNVQKLQEIEKLRRTPISDAEADQIVGFLSEQARSGNGR
jgi:cytochrome c5